MVAGSETGRRKYIFLKKLKIHNFTKNSKLILFQARVQPRNKTIKRYFAFEYLRMGWMRYDTKHLSQHHDVRL